MSAKIIPVQPFDLVVFGGTGDLTLRKLLPALYYRFRDGQMPEASRVVAVARSDIDSPTYRDLAHRALSEHVGKRRSHARALGALRSAPRLCVGRRDPRRRLGRPAPSPRRRRRAAAGVLPGDRARSVRADLPRCRGGRPGHARDARGAREADRPRPRLGDADQRRGRRGLQRAADLPDRPLSRQGDGAEPDGAALRQLAVRAAVERRRTSTTSRSPSPRRSASEAAAATTTRSGALRDMVQNHLLQLLCLVAMEPPASMDADAVRDEKLKVLQSLKPIVDGDVATRTVRGQYRAGAVDGVAVPGYRRGASTPSSTTETFVALKAEIEQLALGRRAVLPAHRQAPAAARVGDRDPLPPGRRIRSSRRASAPSTRTGW